MEPSMCKLCRSRPTVSGECVCAMCLCAWRSWLTAKRRRRAEQAEKRLARSWRRSAPPWAAVVGNGSEL
jgi:hypothetical protein